MRVEPGQARFLYTAFLKAADALCVVTAWYATWFLRFRSGLFSAPKGVPDLADYDSALLPLVGSLMMTLHIVGAYRRDRVPFGFRALKKIVEGAFLGTLVFLAACYFLNAVDYSRVHIVLFTAVLTVFLVVERGLLHVAWTSLYPRFVQPLRVLLVGEGSLLEMYKAKLDARRPYPLEWIGRVGGSHGIAGLPYLGNESDLPRLVRETKASLVVVSYPGESVSKFGPVLELLSNELVGVKVLPDFGRYSTFTYGADHECGIPLLVFNQAPTGASERAVKRTIDVVVSAAVLTLGFPLYALLALLVKLSSKGPIFYSQIRVGADGKVFTLYKYRSMRTDAEAKTGAVWAKPGDNRTTKVGAWLRKTSLDELPQFFNVLRGDMSLVGPRPERPVFVEQFRESIPKYMLRHRMKSGITGWAQINGWRGNTSIEERIKHDLYYIGHWSHRFDLKILLLTLFRVNRNAY